jgi:hypothetical protein
MTQENLSPQEKYRLFKEALDREDYLTANKFREDDDPELRKRITPDETRRVHEGIKRGFEESRYSYD